MSEELPHQPRKEPSQERSRFLVDAILEATARILSDQGPEAVTTNRIAEVAGVSIGSLYQYFPNKEAVLARLIELELERDIAFIEESLASTDNEPLEEVLRSICSQTVARFRDKESLHQHLLPMVPELERRTLVRRRVSEVQETFLSFLKPRRDELAETFAGEDGGARLETAVFVATRATEAALNAAKTEAPEHLEHPDLVEHLASIFISILIDDQHQPTAPGPSR